ncbi:hypothetical protein GCM10008905_24460 [Clostridium malenominatum]|uniref:DUF11 domain-containing protein n=1 Tax=Clostridium malenominatum TaxID=1539 RepID=A0ABN1J2X8_9CLOT
MFNVTWIPINNNVLTDDLGQGQCGIDIVGDNTHPALFIGRDSQFVYFRMRVNCDPRMNNKPDLENRVWGVLIKDTLGTPLFTVRVNAKNDPDSNAVQVYTADNANPFLVQKCSNTIAYGDSGNVQINIADSSLFSFQDYFLDFRVPLSCFSPNFFDGQLIYCGFTSDDAQNINKEVPPPYTHGNTNNSALCGATPPPQPRVRITKTVSPLAVTNCPTPQTFTVVIRVENLTNEDITVTITDTINPAFVTAQHVHTFLNLLIPAMGFAEVGYTVDGFFPNVGNFPFNTAVVTENGQVIGEVVGPNIAVAPCGRGVFIL